MWREMGTLDDFRSPIYTKGRVRSHCPLVLAPRAVPQCAGTLISGTGTHLHVHNCNDQCIVVQGVNAGGEDCVRDRHSTTDRIRRVEDGSMDGAGNRQIVGVMNANGTIEVESIWLQNNYRI